MSGRWEMVQQPPVRELHLVATTCDRCGRPATIRGADARAWGEVCVTVQGVEQPEHADLCQGCALALRVWLNTGSGGGMVDGVAFANEHITPVRQAVADTPSEAPPGRQRRRRLGLSSLSSVWTRARGRARG